MARYRRSYKRTRPRRNMVWQPMFHSEIITIPERTPTNTVVKGTFFTANPGVGEADTFTKFDDTHTLERIRGSMAHNAQGQESSTVTDWFPFTVAAIKVPSGMTIDAINLFDSTEADDFFFRMDAVCNAGTSAAIPNWHDVDSKSKRRFEVGDAIAWLWSAIAPATDTRAATIEFSMNLRVLWKLT